MVKGLFSKLKTASYHGHRSLMYLVLPSNRQLKARSIAICNLSISEISIQGVNLFLNLTGPPTTFQVISSPLGDDRVRDLCKPFDAIFGNIRFLLNSYPGEIKIRRYFLSLLFVNNYYNHRIWSNCTRCVNTYVELIHGIYTFRSPNKWREYIIYK